MNDFIGRVVEEEDFFKKILSKVPGFNGYVERNDRRTADKLLRETIADHFEALWQRISGVQRSMVNESGIEDVYELEAAAIKLRQFIDRIRTASYGYAGFFDAVKIKTEELNAIYQHDLQLLDMEDEVGRAIDNVESSLGTDGQPAAINHLVSLSQQCIDVFEKRKEVIVKSAGGNSEMTSVDTTTT